MPGPRWEGQLFVSTSFEPVRLTELAVSGKTDGTRSALHSYQMGHVIMTPDLRIPIYIFFPPVLWGFGASPQRSPMLDF